MPLWRVIAGLGATQIIGWGTTYYAIGALSQDIGSATHWPPSLIFGAFSAALLLSGAISRLAGRFVDRAGGRLVMSAGSILNAVGCLILGLAATPLLYVVGWLVLGVAMRLALYDAAFVSLAQIAPDRTRRSISYLALYAGFASTIFWPLSHYLSQQFGWQTTFLIYAALHVLVCLPIHWNMLRQAQPTDASEELPVAAESESSLSGADRRFAMVAFAAAIALNGLVFSAISAHVLPLFEGLGFPAGTAVMLAALIGPSQVAARIGEILMGGGLKPTRLGVIAFGLLPLALAVFVAAQFSAAAALFFALCYGASNGLITIAKGAVPLALFGRVGYGEMLGTLAAPNLVLNALAPMLFAVVLEASSAAFGLILALIIALFSAAAMALLARRFPL